MKTSKKNRGGHKKMAANVVKGGSSLLLSFCNRSVGGYGFVNPRSNPLLFTSYSSPSCYYSQSKQFNGGRGKERNCCCNGVSMETPKLSHNSSLPSIPIITTNHSSRRRTVFFCTVSASNVADSSSSASPVPTTSSLPSSGEKVDDREPPTIKDVANTLDIRVGRILRVWKHEEADSLYVEEVDIGEEQPRTICSGLVKYMPIEDLQDRKVIVLANLKPRNMRGVKSYGMLMAASDASHEKVELLVPPEGSIAGERVWFGSVDDKDNLPDAASPNQIQKKKIWEQVQPHLKTDDSYAAALGLHSMRTSAGVVVSISLKNANIS